MLRVEILCLGPKWTVERLTSALGRDARGDSVEAL